VSFASPTELVDYIREEDVAYVDVRFCDVPGVMQHFSVPAQSFDADLINGGLAFDGSSIRGFQSIHESDMLLLPDIGTAQLDPFRAAKTLNVNCFVHDPFTREPYSRDPRNVARKAQDYVCCPSLKMTMMASSGLMRIWM
jgi:glutamine synthetase